ncbi:MAG: YdcF family protein [Acetobacter sp.]|nr:YdcF family protein [Bacteroides sp.]MCM1340275.1 YdcF family protein [Acetobacter sp.]MCM1432775.1 YdcF family protein [Clostridiales bacterium]
MKKPSKKITIKMLIKIILILPVIYLLITFVLPIRLHILNIGNMAGIVICAVLIAVIIFFDSIIKFLKSHWNNKKNKTLISSALCILVVGITCFSAALGSVIIESKGSADKQETIIVLGCAVRGSRPSAALKARVNAAYKYLEANPESVAVLSGGQGKDEDLSEAQCMFNLLTEKGIDESRLYMEDKSVNTSTNIEYSKKIIEDNNLSENVAVVSSCYHLKRAKMISKKQGLDVATISAPCSYLDKSTFYLREVFGVAKEFIF